MLVKNIEAHQVKPDACCHNPSLKLVYFLPLGSLWESRFFSCFLISFFTALFTSFLIDFFKVFFAIAFIFRLLDLGFSCLL